MKNWMLAAAAALITLTAFGQDFQKYKIAFRAQPNVGWLTPQNNNMEATGAALKFGFGVAADIAFAQNYSIGTGLNIDNMGGKISYLTEETLTINGVEGRYIVEKEQEMNLRYIEIPMTLKLRTNEIGYITYWGQFGLGLGINWRAQADETDVFLYEYADGDADGDKQWNEISGLPNQVIEKEDISDEISIFRPSMIIGAGIEYNLSGSTSIVAGLTYNNGLVDIFENSAKGVKREQNTSVALFDTLNNGEEEVAQDYQLKSTNHFVGLTVGILF